MSEAVLPGKNRAAKVSVFFALGSFGAMANFATPIGWLNPPVFVGLALLCALVAVPAGHVGRFRARRLSGDGKGMALAGLLGGWLMLLVTLLALASVFGLLVGLSLLADAS
ncbi:DUF4190 domain-containing protein [Streptomyces sp. NPDC059385]|uniref:DUF4190 domain-containing protein n=1 Tax=Streptomyces sp. NPDC059385 TaxID=3346817 RepID=UPI0036C1DF98